MGNRLNLVLDGPRDDVHLDMRAYVRLAAWFMGLVQDEVQSHH